MNARSNIININRLCLFIFTVFILIIVSFIVNEEVFYFRINGIATEINIAGAQRKRMYKILYLINIAETQNKTELDKTLGLLKDEITGFEYFLISFQNEHASKLESDTNLAELTRIWDTKLSPELIKITKSLNEKKYLVDNNFENMISNYAENAINPYVFSLEAAAKSYENSFNIARYIIIIIGLLLVVFLFILFNKKMAKPIKKFSLTVQDTLSNASLNNVSINGVKELMILADCFNDFIEVLKNSITMLTELSKLDNEDSDIYFFKKKLNNSFMSPVETIFFKKIEIIWKQFSLLKVIVDSLETNLAVIDPSTYDVIFSNKLLGFHKLKEKVKCYKYLHNSDVPCDKTVCPMAKVIETKKNSIMIHKNYEDGVEKYYEVIAQAIFEANGEISWVVHYETDISMYVSTKNILSDLGMLSQCDIDCEKQHKLRIISSKTQELYNTYEFLAQKDSLTGLLNRIGFDYYLYELKDILSNNKAHAMIRIDIDDFKLVNDKYGHNTGDMVLKYLGTVILKIIRNDDIAARVGGDEFSILLTSLSDVNDALNAIKRIFNTLAKKVTLNEHQIAISVSVGCAFCLENEVFDKNLLLDLADKALYRSKSKGKGTLTIYDKNEF